MSPRPTCPSTASCFRASRGLSVNRVIHEGVNETSFTVHEVDRAIDAGKILCQEKLPVAVKSTLRETVKFNSDEIAGRVPAALARVVGDFGNLWESA